MKRLLVILILATLSCLAVMTALAAPLPQEQRPTIAEPKQDAAVRGVVQIVGSATHPQFQRYELYYAPWPPSDQTWIFIGDAHYQQQPLGLLGTWPTGSIPDGQYALRVRVVKADGNYIDSESRRVMVANKRAVETPTPLPTFAIPTAVPTPLLPTATIVVTVPTVSVLRPTATPRPEATSLLQLTPGSGAAGVSVDQLISGARLIEVARKSALYTLAAFGAIAVFFAVKWVLAWLWHKIRP
jgi:hypothetical protein